MRPLQPIPFRHILACLLGLPKIRQIIEGLARAPEGANAADQANDPVGGFGAVDPGKRWVFEVGDQALGAGWFGLAVVVYS